MGQEQIQEQVMLAQGLAGQIEFILRRIFGCERFGFGGQVNSDKIRRHPYLSMVQGLAYLYALNPQKRNVIEEFVEHFSFYENMHMEELLSFDSNEKIIDKCTIQIEKDNGLEQVKYMIEEFKKVIG